MFFGVLFGGCRITLVVGVTGSVIWAFSIVFCLVDGMVCWGDVGGGRSVIGSDSLTRRCRSITFRCLPINTSNFFLDDKVSTRCTLFLP